MSTRGRPAGPASAAAIAAALAAGARAARPQVLICRTSTRHGLACLPPDADGHFIKLPAGLAGAAAAELRAELDRLAMEAVSDGG